MWNRNIAAKGSEAVCTEPDCYHPYDDDNGSNDYDDNDDDDDDDFVGQWSVSVSVVVGFLNVSAPPEFFIKSCCYRDQLLTIQHRHHCGNDDDDVVGHKSSQTM